MARVTFMNAIVQGKVGGGVYSRNKGGYYMKSFSKPLNPNSQAQANARTNFACAASSWHALTDIQKATWNSYASTHFKPKGGLLTSFRSGFQAYVSLFNAAMNANSAARATTIDLPVGLIPVFGSFQPTQIAPAQEFSNMIQNSTGAPLPLLLNDFSLESQTGAVTIKFDFGHSQANEIKMLDAVGSVPCGIVVQMSKSMTQSAQFVSNPRMSIITAIKPITDFGTWAPGQHINFVCDSPDFDITKHKLWVTAGEKVSFSAFLVGENGATASLGQLTKTVT